MGAIQYFILVSWSLALVTQAAFDSDQGFAYYNDDAAACIIERDTKSPYVTALNERLDVVGGCLSRDVTQDNREVHVINILQNSRRRGVENVPTESAMATEVTLKLSPRRLGPDIVEHTSKLLFVLNSEQPVIWNIQDDHMSNTTRHLFWISKNSRLHKDHLRLRIKIKKQEMPHQPFELVQWVRNQSEAAALTSYAEVQQAVINTIDFKVGIDPSLPSTCDDNYKPRPDVTASSLHTQKTNSCIAVKNEGHNNRDVHIIEVHTSKNSPTETTDIVLDIKAYDKRRRRNRGLFLVLKSHSDVKWKIHAKGIRGMVEIIADDPVDTNSVQVQSVSVAAERLTNIDGAKLITWTRERYGPAVSYTEAREANKFLLYIDGAAHAPAVPTDVVTFEKPEHSPFETPSRTKKAIAISQIVNCKNEVLVVTLRKNILNGIGVFKQHLSLLDETCKPNDNATHYIFESKMNRCGTTIKEENGDLVYQNAIVLHKISPGVRLDREDFSGSGYEFTPDGTHLDDEDFPLDTDVDSIRSDFKCQKNAASKVPHVEFNLNLYKDEDFVQLVSSAEFPYTIDRSANVYLEATVKADPGLQVVVQDCWISMIGSTEMIYFIYNGCMQTDVAHINTSPVNIERFSLSIAKYAEGESRQRNIVCRVGICSSGPFQVHDVDQCSAVPDSYYCSSRDQSTYLALSYSKTVLVGPLLMEELPVSPGMEIVPGVVLEPERKLGEESQTVDDAKVCGQQQGPPGLDSTMVVVIAFAAFIIGVLLVLALWFIHAKTVPRAPRFQSHHNPKYLAANGSRQRARFAETSGESTPSSTAPITIHQVNHH